MPPALSGIAIARTGWVAMVGAGNQGVSLSGLKQDRAFGTSVHYGPIRDLLSKVRLHDRGGSVVTSLLCRRWGHGVQNSASPCSTGWWK